MEILTEKTKPVVCVLRDNLVMGQLIQFIISPLIHFLNTQRFCI